MNKETIKKLKSFKQSFQFHLLGMPADEREVLLLFAGKPPPTLPTIWRRRLVYADA